MTKIKALKWLLEYYEKSPEAIAHLADGTPFCVNKEGLTTLMVEFARSQCSCERKRRVRAVRDDQS